MDKEAFGVGYSPWGLHRLHTLERLFGWLVSHHNSNASLHFPVKVALTLPYEKGE